MQAKEQVIYVPTTNMQNLTDHKTLRLIHDGDNGKFIVEVYGITREVSNCWVDAKLRKLSTLELNLMLGRVKQVRIGDHLAYLTKIEDCDADAVPLSEQDIDLLCSNEESARNLCTEGYIVITKMSDGEFRLEFQTRIKGGVWDDFWTWLFGGPAIQEAVGTPGHLSIGGVWVAGMCTNNIHDAAVLAAGDNVSESWFAHCAFSSSDTDPKEERKQRHDSQQKGYDFY
jgi:hypothetical protein